MQNYNWSEIKIAFKRELKSKFTPKIHQYNLTFEQAVELLGKTIVYKISDKELDGQEFVILRSIHKFYNTPTNRADKLVLLNILTTSFESFLHKVLFLTDSQKYQVAVNQRKGLKYYIEELNLNKANNINILYDKDNITDNSGFPLELHKTYLVRNKVHKAVDWSEQEIIELITSCLVSYLFTVIEYYNILHSACQNISVEKEVSRLENNKFIQDESEFEESIEILDNFNIFLNSPNASFAHRRVNDVFLNDIYTPPHLKYDSIDNINQNRLDKIFNITELLSSDLEDGNKFCFIGDNLSGKTSLCKYLFKEYYAKNYIPVYIRGYEIKNNIRTEALKKLLNVNFKNQYKSNVSFNKIEKHKIIIIIDDFHKATKSKQQFWVTLIRNLTIEYSNIIITGDKLMPIETILDKRKKSKENIFEDFELYTILEFGPHLRHQIVNKWNTLGIDIKFTDKNTILKNNDAALNHIEKIIGRNYVPSYPFFILTLLQALESKTIHNPNYSIHGFYYEILINAALEKAVDSPKEISLYNNYLTHFSYFLFTEKIRVIDHARFKTFHNLFEKRFDVKYNVNKIKKSLNEAKLILVSEDGVRVRHNYIYYFFTAKYLANNINKKDEKEVIIKMSKRVYRDEYANIIMFLTHLSKDEFIINQLLSNAKEIFPEYEISKLEEDVQKINALIKELPEQVLKSVNIDDYREDILFDAEEKERLERESEILLDEEYDLDEDLNTIDILTKFTLALKTIDLLGQIAKKYWGELTGNQKYNIVSQTYYIGLRALSSFLFNIQDNSEFIIQHLKHIIKEKHVKEDSIFRSDIESEANSFIFRVSFLLSWAIIKRISTAVGDKSLSVTFNRVLSATPYNSTNLINISIKLDTDPNVPLKDIADFKKNMHNNFLSHCILQNLVLNHLYMFSTSYKMKQKLCELLGIKIKDQRLIEIRSKTIKK